MRKTPQLTGLRALVERRGSRQVLLGLGLLLPATAFMARVPEEGATLNAEQKLEERVRADIVAEAWRARMEDANSRVLVLSLAEEYDVSVTLAEDIHEAAQKEEIDPKMAFGLVRAESSFRKNAVSPVGAVGLTQVMPSTARWLVPGTTRSDLLIPTTNLEIGFKYLRSLINKYDGDERLALTAYNRGPGTVAKLLKRGRDPDNGYAQKVLTGSSEKHVKLMNAKFGTKKGRS